MIPIRFALYGNGLVSPDMMSSNGGNGAGNNNSDNVMQAVQPGKRGRGRPSKGSKAEGNNVNAEQQQQQPEPEQGEAFNPANLTVAQCISGINANWDQLASQRQADLRRIKELEKTDKEDKAQVKELLQEVAKLKKSLLDAQADVEKKDKDAKMKASELDQMKERERKLKHALTQAQEEAADANAKLTQAMKRNLAATHLDAKQKKELEQLKKDLVASGKREELLKQSVDTMLRQVELTGAYKAMTGQKRSSKEGEGEGSGPDMKQPKLDLDLESSGDDGEKKPEAD